MAGVLPAVLRAQVPQAQGPLLPASLSFSSFLCASLLLRRALLRLQGAVVLEPDDVRAGLAAGRALEAHGAAHGPRDHALPHLSRLGEAGTH